MTIPPIRGVIDTNVHISSEEGRPINEALLPTAIVVSVVTVAELQAGVLAASDDLTRARRQATLASLQSAEVLPIDETVAHLWAEMRAHLAEIGRRVNVNDLWIAATAAAHRIPVVTQDDDFDALEGVGGLAVVRV